MTTLQLKSQKLYLSNHEIIGLIFCQLVPCSNTLVFLSTIKLAFTLLGISRYFETKTDRQQCVLEKRK